MKIFIITTLITLSQFASSAEVFYFGDSHSTGTVLGQRIKRFLESPRDHGCLKAEAISNDVVKLNGNGLDPRHWLSSNTRTKQFLYKTLEQSKQVTHAPVGKTALDQVISDYGQNPDRKLVMEFGDNSLGGNYPATFASNIKKMIKQLGVSPKNCLIVSPHPHIKPELEAGKKKILAALREIRDEQACQVVFFDESHGRIPLTDGIHSTASGYSKWADQVEAGMCNSTLLNQPSDDSVRGCDNCEMEGLPVPAKTTAPLQKILGD